MKAFTALKTMLFAGIIVAFISCKKNDNSELDNAGDTKGTEMNTNQPDTISSDTISGGKEGINGSGVGSGNPNSSGTADQTN